jgi:ABC-type nitrate/sulfonate/bicarbonate transport system substrate-binding protein
MRWLAVILIIIVGYLDVSAAELTKIYAGYGGIAGYQLPLWINKEIGISRKYGIDIEPLLVGGGSLNMQALLAGSIQLSQNSASSAIQSVLRGAPIVLIATQESRMPFQVVSRPEIKSPEQLIGKKIGIQRFGGSKKPASSGRCAHGRSIRAR